MNDTTGIASDKQEAAANAANEQPAPAEAGASPRPAADKDGGADGAEATPSTLGDSLSREAVEKVGQKVEAEGDGPGVDLVMRIPVTVQVVLGQARMPIASLMKLGPGSVVPLDHKVGEPVDVVVNGRLVARGEVVLLEEDTERFGISLTEIVGPGSRAC